MSNGLVKWRPGALAPGSKMDAALAKLPDRRVQPTPRAPATPPALAPHPGEVRDVVRICAIHDKPWAARYIAGADNGFYYAQSIKITQSVYLEQYADAGGDIRQLDGDDLAEEFCPWCGGHGRGSVRCGRCGQEICYGKVVGRYFRCRTSCSGEGTMTPQARTHAGVTPGPAPKGGYSAR